MLSSLPQKIDLLQFHDLNSDRYPFLLESVANGTEQSRYDILLSFPQETLSLTSDGKLHGANAFHKGEFLSSFDAWFGNESRINKTEHDLPFSGGWFIFLAYELIKEIEPSLTIPSGNESANTIAYAARCPAAIIVDHKNNTTQFFTEDDRPDLLKLLLADYALIGKDKIATDEHIIKLASMKEEPGDAYYQSVKRIKNYITEGDVFQVNLSRLWKAEIESNVSASDLYKNLRVNNPAPFSGLASLPEATIISSSPERLVRVRDMQIESRPIAGTRPRSVNKEEDNRLSAELLSHPKEQAEHIMLIDLERNDLGRVCEPGSIHVNELMSLESYEYVHHIVSNVKGKLKNSVSPADIIRAVFPGGTITGCPKIRCMEIITELEKLPRGAYTGSMGYINLDGSMDLNILIRTILMQDNEITLRTGAGIVYDSDAKKELNETRDKARGMLRALSIKDA